jgi:non-specific serine/threonine protein kinase
MGEVYRARDTKLKRDVAVKMLTQEFARDAGHVLRFNREAELLASLNHPNLAAIYSVGEYEGRPFIVMELLEGQTLKATIESGRIPYPKVLDLAIQISDAPAERAFPRSRSSRHQAGQYPYHSSRTDKDPRLRHCEACRRKSCRGGFNFGADAAGRELLTEAGTAIGTVAYMSPEQVRGEELDGARTCFRLASYSMKWRPGGRLFRARRPA